MFIATKINTAVVLNQVLNYFVKVMALFFIITVQAS